MTINTGDLGPDLAGFFGCDDNFPASAGILMVNINNVAGNAITTLINYGWVKAAARGIIGRDDFFLGIGGGLSLRLGVADEGSSRYGVAELIGAAGG